MRSDKKTEYIKEFSEKGISNLAGMNEKLSTSTS